MFLADLAFPVFFLRVFSPAFVFIAAVSLFFLHAPSPTSPSPITSVVVANTVPRRASILLLLTLLSFTFLLDGLAFVVYTLIDKQWPPHTGIPINTVVGLAAFSGLAALGAWKDIHGVPVWSLRRIKVVIGAALAFDIILVVILGLRLQNAPPHIPEKPSIAIPALLHVAFPAFRVLLLVSLFASLLSPRIVYTSVQTEEDVPGIGATASSFLLPPDSNGQPSTGLSPVAGLVGDTSSKYGTFRDTRSNLQRSAPVTRAATPALSTGPDSKSDVKSEISHEPTWAELWKRIRRLSPYLWPHKNGHLQLLAMLCIFILLVGRVINFVMPLALGGLVSVLEGQSKRSPWPLLFGYVGLRFLQGSGGLAAIRDCLWAPVMQYSDSEMSQLSFDHLLNLSFAWHTRRKTGEILRVLDRGAAINHTFELLLFNIAPTFIDIVVALVAFCILFDWTLACVIFFVMFAYVAASVILTQWRTRLRRQMNDRDVLTRGIHTDCLLNYETVKYFGGEEHEGGRYKEAIREYQALEYKVIVSLNLLNLVQNSIITLGLLIGSLIVVQGIIAEGKPQASKFVIFITYLAQLYTPLNQLGYIYRSVNQSLVDTERLLALLNEPTEVNDKPNAPDLMVTAGEIEFENVNFSYDFRTTALNGVSFKVPKGSSVALVGESGAGKSTILRLLYRFYDLQDGGGRILIDGQDIRDITQKSLRQAIGVVPQDSVLFNSSIAYNIGYGKFGSNEEEIEAAARSAQMHERIMSFPDGYATKVGERGVRLSGGEKQRVAIARTLLKNPPILLLDEATSALDTSTEKDIQKALQNLMKGRSSLSIAHRLSTIASADLILVLKDGHIVEQGTHKELMALDGIFASMWADQVSSTEDPPISIGESSVKKEASAYDVETTDFNDEVLPEDPIVMAGPALADNVLDPLSDLPASIAQEESPDNTDPPKPEELDLSALAVSTPVAFPSPVVAFPSFEPSLDSVAVETVDVPRLASVPIASPIPVTPVSSQMVQFPTEATSETTQGVPRLASVPIASLIPVTPVSSQVVQFPTETTSETTERQPERVISPTPGVTFGADVLSQPSRTGTPDVDAEPKRKRISSQNFQRLARRISLTTRRQSSTASILPSSIIPGLKRDQSPRVSTDDGTRGESSTRSAHDSPAGSVKGDDKGWLKKKERNKKGGS